MSAKSNHPERETQDRLIKFFKNELHYEYLGNLEKYPNDNIRWGDLKSFLTEEGYSSEFIEKITDKFHNECSDYSVSLFDRNKNVYNSLKYGIKLSEHPGESEKTVYLIDWKHTDRNKYYIAEEVTVSDNIEKRPDIVLYINGIAIAVIELKKSTVSVSEGIRQNITNQSDQFIQRFFSTIQICAAANDSEGLRYGTIETKEKYYLEWKEDQFTENPQDKDDLDIKIENKCSKIENLLDKQIYRIFQKDRLLDIIYNFLIFDSGIKKLCRYNQFYAIKRCQKRVLRNQGGIIWHTQGSGKSLTMVWLAKWIVENINDSRILIVTDREELDDQIKNLFIDVGLPGIKQTTSSKDLLSKLDNYAPSIICSLIHKFGRRTEEVSDLDYEKYIEELKKTIPTGFKVKGKFFVFVDECHRTNSGKLHTAMKTIMPDAVFIGFTGTPLLKADKNKNTTSTLFGGFIHTYKFDQAVSDGVVLDLRYEAREIPQDVNNPEKIDTWFNIKTKGLTPKAAATLKEKWATMQQLYSSTDRLEKIVLDIIFDFNTKPRLSNGHGNAILVASSISEACRYYEIFQNNGFKECAIISSYKPDKSEFRTDMSSLNEETDNWKKHKAYLKMLGYDNPNINVEDENFGKKVDKFEKDAKEKFVEQPAKMKLLIVVDKLLTGFDAPHCTYLYIDKNMQDHGLFQAICRVNRLDGEEKEFGYVVDYKELFGKLKDAVNSYTGGAFAGYDENDISGLLKDRLLEGKKHFESLLDSLEALTDGVAYPRSQLDYKHFFCGESGTVDPENDSDYERLRSKFYKLVSSLDRAYAELKPAFDDVGYSKEQQDRYNRQVKDYTELKQEIGLSSGDFIDLKKYDSDMRFLIDHYISADAAKRIGNMEDFSLLAYIEHKKSENEKNNNGNSQSKQHTEPQKNIAETIENNIRKELIEKAPINPKYFQKLSELFQALIEERKKESISYKEMLDKYAELVKDIEHPEENCKYPDSIKKSAACCALYDNFGHDEEFTLALHKAIMDSIEFEWKGDFTKEQTIRGHIYCVLNDFKSKILSQDEIIKETENIFTLVKEQEEY